MARGHNACLPAVNTGARASGFLMLSALVLPFEHTNHEQTRRGNRDDDPRRRSQAIPSPRVLGA
jgi:hypothetical protein